MHMLGTWNKLPLGLWVKLKEPVVADGIPVISVLWKTLGYMAGEDCVNLETDTGEEICWETWCQQKACPCCRHSSSFQCLGHLSCTLMPLWHRPCSITAAFWLLGEWPPNQFSLLKFGHQKRVAESWLQMNIPWERDTPPGTEVNWGYSFFSFLTIGTLRQLHP